MNKSRAPQSLIFGLPNLMYPLDPKTSKTELGSPVSYKALGAIIAIAVAYQIFLFYSEQEGAEHDLQSFTYTGGALAAGIAGIIIGKRYRGSEVFGKTYFALGLGFLMLFVGDMLWNYYEMVLEIDPYPSLADLFYLLFPVFATYHLVINIRYFKKDLGIKEKGFVPALALVLVGIYALISFDEIEGHTFDFYFGLVYVLSSSVILSLAILGAAVFRHSILGIAWLLLAGGIFIFTVSDTWYYYTELAEEYTLNHPTNTLWFLSFMVVVYALYKHKKII